MAGLGGAPKLTTVQQENAVESLMPALVCGERLLDRAEGTEDAEVVTLLQAVLRCVGDIRRLLTDVEEGHSRQSTLDPADVEWMVDFLVKEIKELHSRLRTALSLSAIRGGRTK